MSTKESLSKPSFWVKLTSLKNRFAKWFFSHTLTKKDVKKLIKNQINNKNSTITIPRRLRIFGIYKKITSIGNKAFEDNTNITKVIIPDSVKSIGGYAFSKCSALTSVDIPNSVTSIRERVFDRCSALTSVDIPNRVSSDWMGGILWL